VTTSIPKVLILSSTVASSRVGASAASFCLQRLGVETVVLPTTLMGRHPGWGLPGGGGVNAALLRDVWAGVAAQDLKFDAVLTGYMGETAHIDLSVEIIDHVRSRNPDAIIAVDPVMGDHGRLYIPKDRAAAIIERLIQKTSVPSGKSARAAGRSVMRNLILFLMAAEIAWPQYSSDGAY